MIVAGPDFRVPPQLTDLQIIFLILVIATIASLPQENVIYVMTSWFRDPMRNLEVGGKSNSLHVAGLAIDVAIMDGRGFFVRLLESITSTAASVFQRGLPGAWRAFGGAFQAVVESDHVHLELDFN